MHDDIIGIVNSNGTKIVSYTYDSWETISTKLTVNKIVIFAAVYATIKVVGLVTTGAGAIFVAT